MHISALSGATFIPQSCLPHRAKELWWSPYGPQGLKYLPVGPSWKKFPDLCPIWLYWSRNTYVKLIKCLQESTQQSLEGTGELGMRNSYLEICFNRPPLQPPLQTVATENHLASSSRRHCPERLTK